MREFNSRYDVETYARDVARHAVSDYVRVTPPDELDLDVAYEQVVEQCMQCEAVIYSYHAALTVLHGRMSEYVDDLPPAFDGEGWSDHTTRCAFTVIEQIATSFIDDLYNDAVYIYHGSKA